MTGPVPVAAPPRMRCHWCHEVNRVSPVRATHCGQCGHRAEVARTACDCRRCLSRTAVPPEGEPSVSCPSVAGSTPPPAGGGDF